jgi:hypothetical protein
VGLQVTAVAACLFGEIDESPFQRIQIPLFQLFEIQ